ncbi:MAG: hypothetical protein E6G49_06975 [Actinobacteria bacterium]|jgi:hypothetical protein|nr:MAG: hypothetical protein E6G49_06975 [Actinomycetota bacterium]
MATPEPQDISLEAGGTQVRLRWTPVAGDWELGSEPDWSRLEGIRLVGATFEDGATLGVAAVRPRDARGHGDDSVAARFVDAEGLQITPSDALVSVEYDPAREPRRIGIEIWPDADSPPLRIAADREPAEDPRPVSSRQFVPMTFRRDGIAGRGAYETLRQG